MLERQSAKPFLWYTLGRPLKRFRGVGDPYREFNDEYKTIFIHIPKNGGSSIQKALFNDEISNHRELNIFQYYNPNKFNQYFKFAFVRNPWDRIVSAFTYVKGINDNSKTKKFSEEFLSKYDDFSDFVESLEDPSFREKILSWKHFQPQINFITNYIGHISLDYIGRFETIEKDFSIIADKLNIQTSLPHKNKSNKQGEYQSFFSKKTERIIANVYREDIHLFDYEFSGDR